MDASLMVGWIMDGDILNDDCVVMVVAIGYPRQLGVGFCIESSTIRRLASVPYTGRRALSNDLKKQETGRIEVE